jgi:hypothetical protein
LTMKRISSRSSPESLFEGFWRFGEVGMRSCGGKSREKKRNVK